MAKKVTETKPKQEKEDKKQMKVWLSTHEHAVVVTAAHMAGMNVTDYMKAAVLEKAKKDAKGFSSIIDSI